VTALDQLDHTIDRAADKLQELADKAAGQNGLKGKLAEPLAEDAAFLRKLKPSLIAARARGEAPKNEKPAAGTVTPVAPPAEPKPKGKANGGGPNPWLVVAGALVAGIALAKWIDWRGHAHPRD
jgi:sarcosine oxidase gamma subunit